jgi:hypothetical protein
MDGFIFAGSRFWDGAYGRWGQFTPRHAGIEDGLFAFGIGALADLSQVGSDRCWLSPQA